MVWIVGGRLRKVGTYKELSDDDEFMELVGSQVIAEDLDSNDAEDGEEGEKAEAAAVLPQSGMHMVTKQVDKKGLTGTPPPPPAALFSKTWQLCILHGRGVYKAQLIISTLCFLGAVLVTCSWLGCETGFCDRGSIRSRAGRVQR